WRMSSSLALISASSADIRSALACRSSAETFARVLCQCIQIDAMPPRAPEVPRAPRMICTIPSAPVSSMGASLRQRRGAPRAPPGDLAQRRAGGLVGEEKDLEGADVDAEHDEDREEGEEAAGRVD